ncbi:type II toxin-antitoxin system CcdA family antitoxin [Paraburkholderia sediminicola]|uniref:type II toxin-antitoxin system CcdA family antitoxin n=1 Tax=Paraburkholderia sediminicola TaxID=458836 RepID=UPI0038B9A994
MRTNPFCASQHADFIAELNARIERDGLPLDEHRMFLARYLPGRLVEDVHLQRSVFRSP